MAEFEGVPHLIACGNGHAKLGLSEKILSPMTTALGGRRMAAEACYKINCGLTTTVRLWPKSVLHGVPASRLSTQSTRSDKTKRQAN